MSGGVSFLQSLASVASGDLSRPPTSALVSTKDLIKDTQGPRKAFLQTLTNQTGPTQLT